MNLIFNENVSRGLCIKKPPKTNTLVNEQASCEEIVWLICFYREKNRKKLSKKFSLWKCWSSWNIDRRNFTTDCISLVANHQKPSNSFNHVLEIVWNTRSGDGSSSQRALSSMLDEHYPKSYSNATFLRRYEWKRRRNVKMLTTEDCWAIER